MTTAGSDRYRSNPARDLERFAFEVVGRWVGDRGTVIDMSAGHEPDLRIQYEDGRLGIGEVGWHEDRDIQAMWQRVFRAEKHQQIELRPGAGQWHLSLGRVTRIDTLYKEVPAFIDALAAESCFRLEVDDYYPRGVLADTARRLGIEYIDKHADSDPSVAIFMMPGTGGAISSDANVIVDWIDSLLVGPDYLDTTDKLLAPDADERHVFIMSGSATEFDVDTNLQRLAQQVPTRAPDVPDGITHVWLTSRFGDGPVAMWSINGGWSTVPCPHVEPPD